MNPLVLKTEYDENDIRSLINTNAEESVYLEFKSQGSLQITDSKKAEIAKDVSSFANSDGGLLIYGINEVGHKADSLSFVDGNQITKEWLEQVIQSKIARQIPGLRVHPIRFDGDLSRTVYVIQIPSSFDAPHMTSEKKFYKRGNFQAVQMEEYEIRALYNRKEKTDLTIGEPTIGEGGGGIAGGQKLVGAISCEIGFPIYNGSNSIESHYKLELSIPWIIVDESFNAPLSKFKNRVDDGNSIFSIPSQSPIFQGEIVTMARATIKVWTNTLNELTKPLKVKLYFTNGVREKEFSLYRRIKIRDKILEDWEWGY